MKDTKDKKDDFPFATIEWDESKKDWIVKDKKKEGEKK